MKSYCLFFSPVITLKNVVNYQLMYHLKWTFLALPQLAHQGHTNQKAHQEESALVFHVLMKITPLHLEVHLLKIVSARRATGHLARPVKVSLPHWQIENIKVDLFKGNDAGASIHFI